MIRSSFCTAVLLISACATVEQATHYGRLQSACYIHGQPRTDLSESEELSCFDRYCDYKIVWSESAPECLP